MKNMKSSSASTRFGKSSRKPWAISWSLIQAGEMSKFTLSSFLEQEPDDALSDLAHARRFGRARRQSIVRIEDKCIVFAYAFSRERLDAKNVFEPSLPVLPDSIRA